MIGTGATAVQVIPEVAKQAAHVWVFQRTPNFDIPGRNGPLAADYAAGVKADYADLWQKARESGFGLPYQVVERSALDFSPPTGSASSRPPGPRAASTWAWRRSATS